MSALRLTWPDSWHPIEPLALGKRIVWGLAIAITVLSAVLLAAVWRNDHAIEADKGVAYAQVLSAGHLRSTVSFVTPDGATYNPPLGVLYPTKLVQGQSIEVEYDRADPDLVRVSGRDVSIALVPVGSVILGTWLIAGGALWLLRRAQQVRSQA
ncbi:DUF3592 domain-containing protein [Tomitella biformata]|uniref:DUF3592 domain-containing protein n=1 Tax=Tomitella biformata TaxID=630403 RepID=UPI0004B9825D|nr:DUF3592 domain-containing protein [Tomitella biformata]